MALGCKELWTIQLHSLWVPRESSPYKDTLESPMCSYSGMYIDPLMTWRTCNESVSTDKEWFADREEVDEIKPSGKSPCLQRCTHYDSNILALLTHKYLRINRENRAAKSSRSGYMCALTSPLQRFCDQGWDVDVTHGSLRESQTCYQCIYVLHSSTSPVSDFRFTLKQRAFLTSDRSPLRTWTLAMLSSQVRRSSGVLA